MRLYVYGLCLLLSCSKTFAQSNADIKERYDQALQQVVVIKNMDRTIPIRDLSTTHIGLITTSLSKSILLDKMQLYGPIRSLAVSDLDHSDLVKSNLILVEIDLAKTDQRSLAYLSLQMDQYHKPYIVILLHGTPLCFPPEHFKSARAIVFSWGYAEYLPIQIAQVLFGAVGSEGRLPYALNGVHRTGSGLSTEDLNRLKYGPPECIGINGRAFKEKLNDAVSSSIANGVFPGANLLVAQNGIVIYHEAFGKPTFESIVPLEKSDLYDLASITKIFGATAAGMVLHSRGLFDPDQTLGFYLPYFSKSDKNDLLWKDILTHRARLPAFIPFYRNTIDSTGRYIPRSLKSEYSHKYNILLDDQLYLHRRYPSLMMKGIKKVPLLRKEGYVYSDLSMILLYKTIEAIVKQPFAQFLDQQLYKPIGAYQTGFLPATQFDLDHIVPTERDSFFRKKLVHGHVHDENAAMLGGISGHAGLFSNANDLAKLAQMLLNNGSYGGKQYLKQETIQLFTSYQYPEMGNRRGLGFDKPLLEYDLNASHVARDASAESYGHSGFTGTFIWMDPKYNLTYILLTNRVYPSRANNQISQRSVRPCIQQIIYDFLLNSDPTPIKLK